MFQQKFAKRGKDEYVTDLKCGSYLDEKGEAVAIRWNKTNIKKGWQTINKKKEYFINHIMDKAMFKIDFIVFIDGLFIEFSENFYIKIGEERN